MIKERTKLLIIVLTFVAVYYIPWANETIRQSGLEAFIMLQEYGCEIVTFTADSGQREELEPARLMVAPPVHVAV